MNRRQHRAYESILDQMKSSWKNTVDGLLRSRGILDRGSVVNVMQADSLSSCFMSAAEPIVIGGCGRSGTTLLRIMLDSHGHICCGPESRLFLPDCISVERLSNLFEIPVETVEGIYQSVGSRAEFIARFFAIYCEATGKGRWAEKTPRNVTQLDFIWAAFPGARFVHMIRDGRDVVCSLRTHPRHRLVDGTLTKLDTRNPIEVCVERWLADVGAARQHRRDPRYLEVRYEDLVLATRRTLEAVLAFVGEPWDENVLHYSEVAGLPSRNVSKFPQNPEAVTPVSTDALGRWKRDLSEEEVAFFKQRAGHLLIELGYVSSNAW
jgi:protein-tyrosine sulfotransferase